MDCLAKIGGAILGPVFSYMFAPVGEYLFSYEDKINNLEDQVRELDAKINMIQSVTEQAKNAGNAIMGHVQDWQEKATTKSEEAKRFLEPDPDHTRARCSCRRPLPNLALRWQLSKEAKKKAEEIEHVVEEANNLGNINISFRPAVQLSFEQKDFEKFETREETLREMMEALRNPEVRMIGLCGLGGMGKTMLVKEVARLAKKDGNLFDKQILAVVSQNPNIEQIQQEIANQLDLKFENEVKSIRAELLGRSLNNGERILIILDDVWGDKLDLSEFGIRFKDDNKEWKIILTSRSRAVCRTMGADEKTTFEIKSLTDVEAANLFNKFVGDIKPEFESLATEVIGECGGLPLAIVTTASALRINKSLSFWRNALLELKRLPAESEIYGKVHRSFKTSFDVLGYEAKSLLLICSAHDEDENVSLEELMGYVMVLDLFGYVYTLKEASDRVESLVNNLKAYSLLSDGNSSRTVKVHDVIRDVAISIASELEKNPMYCLRESVRFEDCLNRENFKQLYAITVRGGGGFNDDQLPERLACPRLKLLMLRTIGGLEITDRFFEETKELKALRLDVKGGKKLASSFRSLQNLKALHLRIWKGEDVDIAIIGELTNLLILDLSDSKDLVALPKEIGNLSRLQVLNLSRCYGLQVIEPYVISRLVQLEELYMLSVREINASLLSEIKDLPKLRVLHIQIRDVSFVPEDIFSHLNLERYHIQIGPYSGISLKESTRVVRVEYLKDRSLLYEEGFQRFMKKSEELRLKSIPGVSHIVNELDASSFQDLECLELIELENLESFMPTSLERPTLFHDKVIFSKLQKLTIQWCKSLRFVWALATFRSLQQLKRLSIGECDLIEEVLLITKEAGDHEEIKSKKIPFPKLEFLELTNLPKLKRFGLCQADDYCTVEFPSLLRIHISGCPELRAFIATSIPSTSTTVEEVEERRMAQEILFSQKVVFSKLQELTINCCKSLRFVWAIATFKSLQQLKTLLIQSCNLIEEVLVITKEAGDHEETESKKITFPKLESLCFSNLLKLKRFGLCRANDYYTVEFPSLLRIDIINCPELRAFMAKFIPSTSTTMEEVEERRMAQEFLFNQKVVFSKLQELTINMCKSLRFVWALVTFESLQQLKRLRIENCYLIEEVLVITKEAGDHEEIMSKKIPFPKLESLHLQHLPKLKRFGWCHADDHYTIGFPSLKSIFIDNCRELRTVIAKSIPSTSTNVEEVEERRMTQEIMFSKTVVAGTSFRNLQELTIYKCNNVQYMFSFAMVESLIHLKVLHVSECEAMEQIVTNAVGEDGKLKTFPKLESLELKDLPKLKRFCEGACIEFPSLVVLTIRNCNELKTFIPNSHESTIPTLRAVEERELVALQPLFNEKVVAEMSFKNLQKLTISECNNVQYMFSFAMVESLIHLKELRVSKCEAMEQIVTNAVGEDGKLKKFPKLEYLELEYLPKLKRFCEGDCIEFPSLVQLTIRNCNELKTSIPNSHESTIPTLRAVEERELVALQPLFNEKVVAGMSFKNLQNLTISECNNVQYMFSFAMVESLNQLTRLYISECEAMEQIVTKTVGEDGRLKNIISFPKLESLHLHHLPELQRFCEGVCIEFPSLLRLGIMDCNELRTFIPNSYESIALMPPTVEERELVALQPLFNEKVATGMSFRNLQELRIFRCNNVQCVFSFAMVESFIQLQELRVSMCAAMEQIVTKAIGEDGRLKNIISFPKLESLVLQYLPELKRFCEGDCIEFPSILKLRISDCYELRTFIPNSHESTIPTLQAVDEERELEAQQPLFNKKVVAGTSFRNLQELTISKCNNVQYMFSFAMVESLIQLKELYASECEAMEQIVTKAVGEDGRLKNIISFPKLESLHLHHLPELQRFCEGVCIEFPSLLRREIRDCDKLRTFIPNSHESTIPTLQAVDEQREFEAQQLLFNEKILDN